MTRGTKQRMQAIKELDEAVVERGTKMNIFDVKDHKLSDLYDQTPESWPKIYTLGYLKGKIELLYAESLKKKGFDEDQIVIHMNTIDVDQISINEDGTYNLVFYSKQEIAEKRRNFIQHVVWDQVMFHSACEATIKKILSCYYPDITSSEMKPLIKKYRKLYNEEYNEEHNIKETKTECVFDNLKRLPGAGWSKQ